MIFTKMTANYTCTARQLRQSENVWPAGCCYVRDRCKAWQMSLPCVPPPLMGSIVHICCHPLRQRIQQQTWAIFCEPGSQRLQGSTDPIAAIVCALQGEHDLINDIREKSVREDDGLLNLATNDLELDI